MTNSWESENNNLLEEQTPANEKSFTRLLRATIGVELDHQRGRASAEFTRMVAAEKLKLHIGAANRIRTGAAELRRFKMWAGAAAGLAAGLALVVGLQVWSNANRSTPGDENVITGSVPVMDQTVYTRDVDGGTVLGSDGPMRMIRNQTVRTTQWFDPRDQATYSITEPVERVGYIPVQPY